MEKRQRKQPKTCWAVKGFFLQIRDGTWRKDCQLPEQNDAQINTKIGSGSVHERPLGETRRFLELS